jgi:uncharacterized protein
MDEILHLLRRHDVEIRTRYAVRGLGLFGSFARGEATAGSDLDLLVEFERPPTLFEFVRLQRHLSELLGLPVDLVMKSALKPAIGQAILSELVPV